MNEVQQAFDNGVESYFANLAKNNQYSVVFNDSSSLGPQFSSNFNPSWALDTLRKVEVTKKFNFSQNKQNEDNGMITIARANASITMPNDSLLATLNPSGISSIKLITDSLMNDKEGVKHFVTQLFLSMTEDVDYAELHTMVAEELVRKNLDIEFAFKGVQSDETPIAYNSPDESKFVMSTKANSTYQLGPEELEMRYTNASLAILKRGLTDLIISLLISLTVIGALLYLYRVINRQKQLAEIKNDLISNITHEFKTPIATVATAIEAISNFNTKNDPSKTKKYLDISGQQLKKLNVMVEKLLETATLDTGALELNKTPVNLSLLLHTMIEKYSMVAEGKKISLLDESNDVVIEADAFHLENAISNLIDNAVKYGGQHIRVSVAGHQGSVQVVVQDDGGFIEKGDKERVFDQFYRVPQGNQHDVKGFGIGLYYSKKIIEKHGGTIDLILAPNSTSFEVAI